MKYVRLLLVCILLMFLVTGCGNKQVPDGADKVEASTGENKEKTENTENKENKVHVADELFDKYEPNVKFVAVKVMPPEYIQEYLDMEGKSAYYEYYRIGDRQQATWMNPECIELPVELQLGEFAYVKADTTFITGGIDGRMHVEFGEIQECRKISLEEFEKDVKETSKLINDFGSFKTEISDKIKETISP